MRKLRNLRNSRSAGWDWKRNGPVKVARERSRQRKVATLLRPPYLIQRKSNSRTGLGKLFGDDLSRCLNVGSRKANCVLIRACHRRTAEARKSLVGVLPKRMSFSGPRLDTPSLPT